MTKLCLVWKALCKACITLAVSVSHEQAPGALEEGAKVMGRARSGKAPGGLWSREGLRVCWRLGARQRALHIILHKPACLDSLILSPKGGPARPALQSIPLSCTGRAVRTAPGP